MKRKDNKLWLYQYPFPAFSKDATNDVILAAYDAGIEFESGLKVKKMPVKQFADVLNDGSFLSGVYWVRFIYEGAPKPMLPYLRITVDDIQSHDNEDISCLDESDIFKIEVLYNELALETARLGQFNNIPFKKIRTEGIMPEILYEAVNSILTTI